MKQRIKRFFTNVMRRLETISFNWKISILNHLTLCGLVHHHVKHTVVVPDQFFNTPKMLDPVTSERSTFRVSYISRLNTSISQDWYERNGKILLILEDEQHDFVELDFRADLVDFQVQFSPEEYHWVSLGAPSIFRSHPFTHLPTDEEVEPLNVTVDLSSVRYSYRTQYSLKHGEDPTIIPSYLLEESYNNLAFKLRERTDTINEELTGVKSPLTESDVAEGTSA